MGGLLWTLAPVVLFSADFMALSSLAFTQNKQPSGCLLQEHYPLYLNSFLYLYHSLSFSLSLSKLSLYCFSCALFFRHSLYLPALLSVLSLLSWSHSLLPFHTKGRFTCRDNHTGCVITPSSECVWAMLQKGKKGKRRPQTSSGKPTSGSAPTKRTSSLLCSLSPPCSC